MIQKICANIVQQSHIAGLGSHWFKSSCVCSVFAGNLGRVDYISDFEYDLFIRPDTCNPRYRVWFYFTVENVKADQVPYKFQKKLNYSSVIFNTISCVPYLIMELKC